jgi:tetratricopeptide (TPR) repeat protein
MAVRCVTAWLALTFVLCASACRTAGDTRGAQRAGYESLASGDYEAARSSFEKASALSTDPEEKAAALLGRGKVLLEQGRSKEAIRDLYEAQRISREGPVASQIQRTLGEAYFQLGDYALARRYISKNIPADPGADREIALARLVICCRAVNDFQGATVYRSRLTQPCSEEVNDILSFAPREARGTDREGGRAADVLGSRGPLSPATPDSSPVSPGEEAGKGGFFVISREYWNARSVKRNVEPMGRVDKITVHHTGGDLIWGSSAADTAEEIRRIQNYHQNRQGWADIGYHYMIDRAGNIWQGRQMRYQGAHARGSANLGNVGIALMGNYVHQSLTTAQYRSLESLILKLCEHFGISPAQVYTHREICHGTTDCPGSAVTAAVREIRQDVRRRLLAYRPE